MTLPLLEGSTYSLLKPTDINNSWLANSIVHIGTRCWLWYVWLEGIPGSSRDLNLRPSEY